MPDQSTKSAVKYDKYDKPNIASGSIKRPFKKKLRFNLSIFVYFRSLLKLKF